MRKNPAKWPGFLLDAAITQISGNVLGEPAPTQGSVRAQTNAYVPGDYMKACLLALSVIAFSWTPALADPITDRQQAMKRISGHVRDLSPYAQGEKTFDAADVMTRLEALQAEVAAYDVAVLFPDGSDSGDTKASSKIFQDRAGFQAAVDAFAADIAAAAAAGPQDAAAFAPLFGEVAANCRSCHGEWRN
jgi:cytochrome c556